MADSPGPHSGRSIFAPISAVLYDLRSGRAGWPMRLALSFAAAGTVLGVVIFVLGLIELSAGRVREEIIGVALAAGAAIWLFLLARLWSGYRRWHRTIRAAFALIGLWMVALTLCAFIAAAARGDSVELLMAGIILLALGCTIAIITAAAYQSLGGKALKDIAGQVKVECPACGYSMVGLESCQCPECGSKFTIDQLIVAQDYAATRALAAGTSPMAAPPPPSGPSGADVRALSAPAPPNVAVRAGHAS